MPLLERTEKGEGSAGGSRTKPNVCSVSKLYHRKNPLSRGKKIFYKLVVVMKKIISFILLGCLAVSAWGCDDADVELSSPVSEIAEESEVSDEISVNPDIEMSKHYKFLKSKYTVISRRDAFGTVYVCHYYFVDGVVAGAKTVTTFSSTESAQEYYDTIIEDYPDAYIQSSTVVNYLSDEEDFYYEYSLEKLEFVLKKSGYTVGRSFDIEDFNKEFGLTSKED